LGIALCMGLVFFSSVMILLTGCLFLIPEKIPEETQKQSAAPRQLQPLLKPLLVAICLLPLGGLDHGIGHPLLLRYDAKTPNGQSRYPRAHAAARGTC